MPDEDSATEMARRILNSTDEAKKPFMSGEMTVDLKAESLITRLITKPDASLTYSKSLAPFKTGMFIDALFLSSDGKPIGGIPFASNIILTGLPNSGKSLFVDEAVLRLASSNHKVCYVPSEEIFRSKTKRYDLEGRLREKAQLLKLDWKTISENLFVLDAVSNAELRDWFTFVSTYRRLVEREIIDMLFIDSITLLEDSRGQLKYRVSELSKYNQLHGVSSILVSQRSIEESDTLAMAGGIGLSHIVDVVMELDYKKISTWDAQMKLDMNVKQSETANFFRVLKCRLCRFDGRYVKYSITNDGFIKVEPKTESAQTKE